MNDPRWLVPILTLLMGTGFILPIIAALMRFSPPIRERISTFSLWLTFLGSIFGMVGGAQAWLVASSLPWISSWNLWKGMEPEFAIVPPLQISFHIDPLSAFFTFLITAFSAIVSIYSFGSLKAPHYRKYRSQIISAFNLFAWSTVMVVLAYDIFSLLLTLEIMTLSFGYLTLYKHRLFQDEDRDDHLSEEQNLNARLAPQIYLAVSHTSTAFLLLALLILAIESEGMNYQVIINRQMADSTASTIVFLLTLTGLGIRAGLTPAHFWVPLVHPSSPTTTHAFSLGIGIKVSIYLMYRFFFQFLQPQAWWGYLLLLVAAFTALVTVWYAIYSHDLKTALAYHSVENIGIICAGIGLGMIFWSSYPMIAALALIASLYHLLNHAVFKGLLYLATGAIDISTHQVVEFDQLGGLTKRYAFTSAMFLAGSFSIAGFPPFNGFISEWLTLQASFYGLMTSKDVHFLGLLIILLGLTLLVASFALTAFCFYKMAGNTLLGLPRIQDRIPREWEPHDVPLNMKIVMGTLAIFCLTLGIFPGYVIPAFSRVIKLLGNDFLPVLSNIAVSPPGENLQQAGLPIFSIAAFSLCAALILILINVSLPRKSTRHAWNCGSPMANSPGIQYTSAATSFLPRHQFGLTGWGKRLQSIPDYLPAWLGLSSSPRYPQSVPEVFRLGYNLTIHTVTAFSEWFGKTVQNRDIRRYLWYIFVANLIAMAVFILVRAMKGLP